MKVIDNILLEWAYRCPDGIVDMNNPDKVKILNEILEENGILNEEETIEDNILNAIVSLNDEEKKKVLSFINNKFKEEIKDFSSLEKAIEDKIKDADIADVISAFAIKMKEEDKLSDYLSSKDNQLSFNFEKTGNLLTILEGTKFNSTFLKKIILYTPTIEGKTTGIGEVAAELFFKGAKKESIGDVRIDGSLIEFKGSKSRFSSDGIAKGREGNIYSLYTELAKKYNITSSASLASYISEILSNNSNNNDLKFINEKINELYPRTEDIEISLEDSVEDIKNKLTKKYIASYVRAYKNDFYMLISKDSLSYNLYSSEELINNSNNLSFSNNITRSSAYPQLSLEKSQSPTIEKTARTPKEKEKKVIEINDDYYAKDKNTGEIAISTKWIDDQKKSGNDYKKYFNPSPISIQSKKGDFNFLKPDAKISFTPKDMSSFLKEGISLQELSDTHHFQKRVTQRGNVLDILNLKEIPLKDFNLDEVKEKLKANISEELKTRILRILSKDVPLSNLYGVGIKVLKPVLIVDGKKYPLKLFAISTKEIKDKEGNIIDEKEVDNVGTLYFITIIDNKATTLLLLDKEDNSDLYFQIKKHLATKKIDRDAEVLSPPTYIYEINLDTLMGVKAQGPTLIDPSTLPYKVRTDYRVGANFDHIIFGTGKIVATSAGSGGKGDSNGVVDWVDVKYPEPHLKGGKLTDIRRFDKVYTLVSPLLMK